MPTKVMTTEATKSPATVKRAVEVVRPAKVACSDKVADELFTYYQFLDGGWSFYKPLQEFCIDRGVSELDAAIAAVWQVDDGEDPEVIIIYDQSDITLRAMQNIAVYLGTNHGALRTRFQPSDRSNIAAIVSTASVVELDLVADKDESKDSSELRLLHEIASEAIERGASDIHFYVDTDRAHVIFRVDGSFEGRRPLTRLQATSTVAAGLNVKSPDYKSVTDDNEMTDVSIILDLEVPDGSNPSGKTLEKVNLRTSKSGALDGPHTVMRVIRTGREANVSLSNLGFDADIEEMLIEATSQPHGIILVVGPTGSGKSVTLSGVYEQIDSAKKIILLEDPVEYRIRRANTVQKPVLGDKSWQEKGLGFVDYLKNALRQDPDIIGISEIRDLEVARVVISSALTGHLMVSTLHANDAIGAISRLIDQGIDPALIAERNLLRCIVSQRLVGKLCGECRIEIPANERPKILNRAYRQNPQGCDLCAGRGINGRTLVGELILFDDACRGYIADGDLTGLESYLKGQGWLSMTDRCRRLVEEGRVDPYQAAKIVSGLLGEEQTVDYTARREAL